MEQKDKKIGIYEIKKDPETLKRLEEFERIYSADFEERYKARIARNLKSEKRLRDFTITY